MDGFIVYEKAHFYQPNEHGSEFFYLFNMTTCQRMFHSANALHLTVCSSALDREDLTPRFNYPAKAFTVN